MVFATGGENLDVVGDVRRRQKLAEQLRGRAKMAGEIDIGMDPIVTQASGAFPGQVQANWAGPLANLGKAFITRSTLDQADAEEEAAQQARSQALQSVLGGIGDKPPTFAQTMQLQELGMDPGTIRDFLPKPPAPPAIGAMLQAGVPYSVAYKASTGAQLSPEETAMADAAMEQYRNSGFQNKLDVVNLRNAGSMEQLLAKLDAQASNLGAKLGAASDLEQQRHTNRMNLLQFQIDNKLKSGDQLLAEVLEEELASKTPEELALAKERTKYVQSVVKGKGAAPTVGTFLGFDMKDPGSLSSNQYKAMREYDDMAEAASASALRMEEVAKIASNPETYSNSAQMSTFLRDLGAEGGMLGAVFGTLADQLQTSEGALIGNANMDMLLKDMTMLGGNDSNQELMTLKSRYAKNTMNPNTVRNMVKDLGEWTQTTALANRLRARMEQTGRSIPGGSYHQYAKDILAGKKENPIPDMRIIDFNKLTGAEQADEDAALMEFLNRKAAEATQ